MKPVLDDLEGNDVVPVLEVEWPALHLQLPQTVQIDSEVRY